MASPGISNQQKSWLLVGCLNLVSEGSGSEAASNRSSSNGSSILEDMTRSSAVFSKAKTAQAANRSLSQVLPIRDGDAAMFPFVDVMFHLGVKVGAT